MDDLQDDVQRQALAWEWLDTYCNGKDDRGLCPICGAEVQILPNFVTTNGRLIGSCKDAFTIAQWYGPEPLR